MELHAPRVLCAIALLSGIIYKALMNRETFSASLRNSAAVTFSPVLKSVGRSKPRCFAQSRPKIAETFMSKVSRDGLAWCLSCIQLPQL